MIIEDCQEGRQHKLLLCFKKCLTVLTFKCRFFLLAISIELLKYFFFIYVKEMIVIVSLYDFWLKSQDSLNYKSDL